MSAEIRVARPEDWRELRELRLDALRTDATAFGDTLAHALARTDGDWRRYASGGDTAVTFLAAVDGRLAGMARGCVLRGDDAGLFAVWVAPPARRFGLGRRLVEAVVEWARRTGASRVLLEVAADRPEPYALYARCGFAPTGVHRPNESHPDVTEFEMLYTFRDLAAS